MSVPAMIFYPGVKLLHADVTQISLIRSAIKLLIEANLAKYFSLVDDKKPTISAW